MLNELKQRLLDIEANDWKIPKEVDTYQLALEAMKNIGSLDPVLRDDLVLTMLWKMITEKMLTKDQLRNLLEISLSKKHLFCEVEEDSVFNRAFTALIVRVITYYHNNIEAFLTEEEITRTLTDIIKYIRTEKDTRGYVEHKGWAHSIAHGADALMALALCNTLNGEHLQDILEVIKEKVCISSSVYIHMESERLVTAVINVIGRDILSEEEIIKWIQSFETTERSSSLAVPENQYFLENVLRFLRALYFRLKYKNMSANIIQELEKTSHSLNSYFNNVNMP